MPVVVARPPELLSGEQSERITCNGVGKGGGLGRGASTNSSGRGVFWTGILQGGFRVLEKASPWEFSY